MDSLKENISQAVKENISLEDDHARTLLWRSLCAQFHKIKDLKEYEEKVARLKAELTVDDEEPLGISSYFISHNYVVFGDCDGTQELMDKDGKGEFESLFLPDLEIFRFKSDDSHLASKVPIYEKFDNNILPEFEFFVFNVKVESNLSHCEISGQPFETSFQSKNEICGCDEDSPNIE